MSNVNDTLNEFLLAYAEYMAWPDQDPALIMRRLCQDGIYATATRDDPSAGREFLMIVFGWVWGKTGNYIEGNAFSAMLMLRLDEIYKVVAAEYGWDDQKEGPAMIEYFIRYNVRTVLPDITDCTVEGRGRRTKRVWVNNLASVLEERRRDRALVGYKRRVSAEKRLAVLSKHYQDAVIFSLDLNAQ